MNKDLVRYFISSSNKKILRRFLAGLLIILLITMGTALVLFCRSLPEIEGTLRLPALKSPATLARDERGVPMITADNRSTVSFALGYAHAQDRFFQMDLLRRSAAGELAALLGADALAEDRRHRPWLLREKAREAVQHLPAAQRTLLQQYTAGVNAGLMHLGSRPFEYWLLREKPQRWQEEDALLTVYALYLDLQESQAEREYARGWIASHSSVAQTALLLPSSSRWDAPLLGPPPAPPAIPVSPPYWWGKRPLAPTSIPSEAMKGSNGWLVSGGRSVTGNAMLANDMHLGLMLPTLWYQATLSYPMDNGQCSRQSGITLPGLPMMVSGSNEHIAWGFTNAYIDTFDWITLPQRAVSYPLRREVLTVSHGKPEELDIHLSPWGPAFSTPQGEMAMRWVGNMPGAVNLDFLSLAESQSVAEAVRAAPHFGLPVQNLLVADNRGHIGWTLAGWLPDRTVAGEQNSFPLKAGGDRAWAAQPLPASRYPQQIDPPDGIIWTANNRQSFAPGNETYNDGGADMGPRAFEIKRQLMRYPRLSHSDMRNIQFDDHAVLINAWRELLLPMLQASHPKAGTPRQQALAAIVQWSGDASADSVGYTVLTAWREALYQGIFANLDRQLGEQWHKASYLRANTRWDESVMRLIESDAKTWVPEGYQDWADYALRQLDNALQTIDARRSLNQAQWGEMNTVRIEHPIARALPFLRRWLAAPALPQSGDHHVPHVSKPAFGASERLIASPGDEANSTLSLPGGQSGHPLSAWFLDGFDSWYYGTPRALAAGESHHTLQLLPEKEEK
ncbi:penicillin acylase family protein [Serratia rhizosphaerae]|uniref:penicillin acylase family protein n=1 Tax=Serratia rhizosphaerae TaxID=2597702 RepID=UPI002DB994DE|nr:penicillin acylase family protein [Serratia rhizosphaerae]MEB6335397.1 penicillin acylase family protein [Serratia rhizosphaerae]